MRSVTFTPLRRNRYRAHLLGDNGTVTSKIVKGAQILHVRRQHENGNRKPLPKLKPVQAELRVVLNRYAECYCPSPSCGAYHYYGKFGKVVCRTCHKPFNLKKE